MKQQDFQQFHEGIEGVYSFYNRELSRFALDVWWNAMKPFDLAVVIDAFNRHLMNPDNGQFLPKPADLVKLLGGSTQDRALVAWAKVDKALRRIGTYESVVFDDPIIHRVLHDMGGWVPLGQKTEDEWPFIAKEFENRYRGFSSRGETPSYPKVLAGIAQSYNDAKGHKTNPPQLIGNSAAAMSVMAGGTDVPLLSMRSVGDMADAGFLRIIKRIPDEAAA